MYSSVHDRISDFIDSSRAASLCRRKLAPADLKKNERSVYKITIHTTKLNFKTHYTSTSSSTGLKTDIRDACKSTIRCGNQPRFLHWPKMGAEKLSKYD